MKGYKVKSSSKGYQNRPPQNIRSDIFRAACLGGPQRREQPWKADLCAREKRGRISIHSSDQLTQAGVRSYSSLTALSGSSQRSPRDVPLSSKGYDHYDFTWILRQTRCIFLSWSLTNLCCHLLPQPSSPDLLLQLRVLFQSQPSSTSFEFHTLRVAPVLLYINKFIWSFPDDLSSIYVSD